MKKRRFSTEQIATVLPQAEQETLSIDSNQSRGSLPATASAHQGRRLLLISVVMLTDR